MTLRNGSDEPIARVFYTAYTLDGAAPAKRPVTFLYNGGPGSSTMWLRMGSFGPVRVVTADGRITGPPPYRLVDNQYSLLDATDLVFIDMPGSGFGRIIGAGTRKDLWGVDQDAAAFAQFIQRYLTTSTAGTRRAFSSANRTARCARACWPKTCKTEAIGLNGIVLLSSFLNANIDYNDGAPVGGGDWAYVLYLPTEAATAWYHHAVPRRAGLDDLPCRSRKLRAHGVPRRAGRRRAARAEPLQRRRRQAARVHGALGAVHPPLQPAHSVRSLSKRAAARPRCYRRADRLALPDLCARQARGLARLGRDSMPRSTRRSYRRATTTYARSCDTTRRCSIAPTSTS